MKKICFLLLTGCTLLSSCMKDTVTEKYVIVRPVYKTKDEVIATIKTGPAQPLNKAAKLFIKDHYAFVNEPDKGVHVIDFSNPSSPVNLSFISIPGNTQVSVRDHYL